MYNFDGRHKTPSKVSLGGASKQVDRLTLLENARAERNRREHSRRQALSSLKIQAWYRGCAVRKKETQLLRESFDADLKNIQPYHLPDLDMLQINKAMTELSFFFKASQDFQRLVDLGMIILKISSQKKLEVLAGNDFTGCIHRLKKLLFLCCRALEMSSDSRLNLATPLRLLEVYTKESTYFFMADQAVTIATDITMCLAQKGFFKYLRILIENRVPSSLDEPCMKAPTPLAGAARDLIVNSLRLISAKEVASSAATRDGLLLRLADDLLCSSMSEQLCYYLIPSISQHIPLPSLLKALLNGHHTLHNAVSVWTLYSILLISDHWIDQLSLLDLFDYLLVLRLLIRSIIPKKDLRRKASVAYSSDSDDSDDDDDDIPSTRMEVDEVPDHHLLGYVKQQCLDKVNQRNLVTNLLSVLNKKHIQTFGMIKFNECIHALCEICFHMLSVLRLQLHKTRFLYTLAFDGNFLRHCWQRLQSMSSFTSTGKEISILSLLSQGYTVSLMDQEQIIPVLGVFACLFKYALFSVYDTDFYGKDAGSTSSTMPFSLIDLVHMSRNLTDVVLGLIELMYPDTKAASHLMTSWSLYDNGRQQDLWTSLCQHVTQLVRQLYARDSRHRFCPEGHWLSPRAAINEENVRVEQFVEENEVIPETAPKPGLSTISARSLAVLKFIPFAIPFLQRVRIFQRILEQDKLMTQGEIQNVLNAHALSITVNRKYLYQDAYDQLSAEREPDIKRVVRVKMINTQGLDEAGIDGGGVFREFMNQLIRTGYDPSYGYFKSNSQELLYPNPECETISPDYLKHFHFLGRMLGKIIYENMMVELPMAEFFLCKLLNKQGSDVDIHHLESLDPELYKNLLYLKNYDGDMEDMSLNFTVMNSDYGETTVEELKPGGKDIYVTNANRVEYIHLMADYRLNKRIRSHCNAFRAGLSDVINIEWLQMFDHRELQILISGAQVPIDIEDLRANTNYSGAYSENDEYIQSLWTILEELTDKQKRQFLKFVTSCSRPPLLGFGALYPKLCIHYGGEEDRLPTASTCMNFLKLPRFSSPELLKNRLIYAIESEAGFELS